MIRTARGVLVTVAKDTKSTSPSRTCCTMQIIARATALGSPSSITTAVAGAAFGSNAVLSATSYTSAFRPASYGTFYLC